MSDEKRRQPRRKTDREKTAANLLGQGIFTELGSQLEGVRTSADKLRGEVVGLAKMWQRRYEEAVVRRRRAVFVLAVAIIVGMWLNDIHMEACVVDAYVRGEEPGAVCDMSHPLHTHGYRDETGIVGAEWPAGWSLVGIGGYVAFFVGGIWWYRRPVPAGE